MRTLKRFTAGPIAACAIAAFPVKAHADLIVEYSTDGINYNIACGVFGLTLACSSPGFVAGGFNTILVSAATNRPGTPALSELLGSALSITNNGPATSTLFLRMTADAYSQPTSGLLLSHIGGTVPIADPSNVLVFSSCLNPSNGFFDCGGAFSPGNQTPNITGGSFNSDASTFVSTTAPYSLTEQYRITLSAGSQINFAASTTLTPITTPEPTTIALVGTGFIAMAGFARRRKRAGS